MHERVVLGSVFRTQSRFCELQLISHGEIIYVQVLLKVQQRWYVPASKQK